MGHERLKVLEGLILVVSKDLTKAINCIRTFGCIVLLELEQEDLLEETKLAL